MFLIKARKQRIGKNVLIVLFMLLTIVFFNIVYESNSMTKPNVIKYKTVKADGDDPNQANVKIIDLKSGLEPKELYDSITCRKSILIYVSTSLCIYDVKIDQMVSNEIMINGIYEKYLMS